MAPKKPLLIVIPVLIVVSLAAFAPALRNGFTNWDDPRLLVDNADIRSLTAGRIGRFFLTSYGGLGGYTPLVFLSYALEYRFFGLDARAFHATNMALHALDVLLILWLLYLLTGGLGTSFVLALLFAIHPLHVEPVAWIQGRKDLLFSLFYLAGLIAYVRFIRQDRRKAWYLLSLLCFALALLSKVAAISFPIVILLLEKHLTERLDRPAVMRSVPFWVLAGLFFLLAFVTHAPGAARAAAEPPGFLQNLGVLFFGFAFYTARTFLPLGLLPRYQPGLALPPWQVAGHVAVFAAVAALLYFAWKRKPRLVVLGLGFALLTLLPTMPFHFFGQPYADRYAYLPIAGLLLAASPLLPEGAWRSRPRPWGGRAVWAGVFLWAVFLGVSSFNLTKVWRDSLSLWSYVIAEDPANTMAYLNRAEALVGGGRLEEALSDYRHAETLAPEDPNIPQSMGGVYFKKGDYQKALELYSRALEMDPLFYEGYMSRGILWGRLKEFRKAVLDFSAALKLNRTYRAYYYRALAYLEAGENTLALEDLRSAYAIEPTEQVRQLILRTPPGRRPPG
jgi:tetratricopeptide (TPR) repeat protein